MHGTFHDRASSGGMLLPVVRRVQSPASDRGGSATSVRRCAQALRSVVAAGCRGMGAGSGPWFDFDLRAGRIGTAGPGKSEDLAAPGVAGRFVDASLRRIPMIPK